MSAEVAQPGTAVGLINQLATQGFGGSNPPLRTFPFPGVNPMDETQSPSAGANPRTKADDDGAADRFMAISVLRRICELADQVDLLSARRPQDVASASKKQRARCLVCPHNPSRLFPGLNTVLLEDVTQFNRAFQADIVALQKFNPPNKTCLGCASQTVSDFEVLYLQFEDFYRWMLAAKDKEGIGPGA